MAVASLLLTVVGWFWIVVGAGVTVLGLVLLGAMVVNRGVPVAAAGMVVLIALVCGPLLSLGGPLLILSGAKLIGGHPWARSVLELVTWIALLASVAFLIYSAISQSEILGEDIVKGAIFFLFTGAPLICMLLLLRSDALRSALIHTVR